MLNRNDVHDGGERACRRSVTTRNARPHSAEGRCELNSVVAMTLFEMLMKGETGARRGSGAGQSIQ